MGFPPARSKLTLSAQGPLHLAVAHLEENLLVP